MMTDLDNISSIMNSTTAVPTTANPSLYPYEARVGVVFVWLLASFLGLVGNSLVIWSIILSKKLRTITNAFVVNLSVADFWTSLSYPWFCIALLSHDGWPLESEVPCIIAAIQFYTGIGASLYNLASIALNRVVLITQSMQTYRRWFSPRKVSVMIAATWAIPCLVLFVPPILGIGEFGYDPQDNTCSDKDGHARGAEYNLVQSLGLYPAPMIIIIGCYTVLYIHLKRHFRKQKKRSAMKGYPTINKAANVEGSVDFTDMTGKSSVSNAKGIPAAHPTTRAASGGELSISFTVATEESSGKRIRNHNVASGEMSTSFTVVSRESIQTSITDTIVGNPPSPKELTTSKSTGTTIKDSVAKNRRAIRRQQLAITKNLFVVFCIFTVLLSPYFISLAVPAGRNFALYGATIAILNSCVNPIIYTINHPQFKVVLRKMIQCRYSEIPEPSDCLKSVLSSRRK